MFTYNVLFKFDNNDGLFSGDDPTLGVPPELRASKNWLEIPGDLPNSFDPEVANWTDLGEANTLMLNTSQNPGDICIRIAPDRRGPVPSTTATLQLVVSFGRPSKFLQPQASPFTHNGNPNGNILTTFPFGPITRNTSRGWFFTFGKIAKTPGKPKQIHRYEFSIGIIVIDGGTVRHYGEDPEIDIGD